MYSFANFLVSLGHTDFLSTLFENSYSLTFKLILQNRLHGLSFTIVRLLSGQPVFLNFDQRLTASLRTLTIYKLPPPPPTNFFKKEFLYFHIVFSCHKQQKTTTDFVHFISFKLHHLTIIEEVLKIKST